MRNKEVRSLFYDAIPKFWPSLYHEPYALYDMHLIKSETAAQLKEATEACGHIFFKVASLLRKVDDVTLLEMGYPNEALPFLRMIPHGSESIIARFDFVMNKGTVKVLEFNSDTPTFIKELFFVNGKVCHSFQIRDINAGEEERLTYGVQSAIHEIKKHIKKENPYVVFTAHKEHIEDCYTAQYLQELYNGESQFVPLESLQIIEGDGLYDEQGKKIDILYRQTFPIECAVLDEAKDGTPIGKWLLELVCKEKLHVVNPPSAFLLQNKAVQAVIWGLHEQNHSFFTEQEHDWIADYFLPTYLEADFFQKSSLAYVKKPVFGREGDTIEIYNEQNKKIVEEQQKTYTAYKNVYQQYMELPRIHVNVDDEKKNVHYIYGCFLINGKPSGIGCRAGGEITNNLSYYVPMGII